MTATDLTVVPEGRAKSLRTVLERLGDARNIVLTTHVNADGDGAGSEAAIAAWLAARGKECRIINPTPFPELLKFLLPSSDLVLEWGSAEAEAAVRGADLVVVLDTSEPNRIGGLANMVDASRTMVVDHHPAGPSVVGDFAIQDPTAAATGELIFDLLSVADGPWPAASVLGIYVALVSDTGSFRFSNTTPRTHAITAELLARGVDPEEVFQRLFATFPRRRLDLLRAALANLHNDPKIGLSWMVIPASIVESLGATPEDFEGLIDHARSIEGTNLAVLFRETANGETKMSFRSNGVADVNRIARNFGGGGHVKAAGALVAEPIDVVVPRVLEFVRGELERQF
ncbi:MAG TPA: bifunctional oligoribonuclease/PAP phosphatase NrnA [Longimicrobiaceae bacterium]|nr:bifunctional oligoribonuclease/PAP phosphatase NrnA [Longimicrobiaceae bacterium]